ncbi:DMT family transporter [Cloacibacillus sp. An23]|uniref:DMT family transporter n=1 Tax=Cloacibacillus sp. An23 TaxID=1965591 RepID=UPI000B39FA4E|nr:DMT family transporter [Cloacibacillus sp. An23]OUO95181.1 EamA family transporter [Cloacibacillus sp. An23]
MDVRTRNLLEIHLSVVLFGLTGLFGKFISLPAPYIVLGRVFFASASMGLFFFLRKKNVRLARAADYAAIAAVGAVLALHWTAFYLSVKLSTVAIGVLTFAAYPIFVTFLEPLLFRERLRGADVLAAFVMFGGVLLVVPGFDAGPGMIAGMIWGMAGSLSYAVMSLLNRKFVARYDGSVVAFYEQGTAALLMLPVLLFDRPHVTPADWALLAVLGVVLTGVAHSLFISGMKSVRAQTAGVIASLESVYGIAAAALFIGEFPTLRELAGGAVILGTALLSTLRSSKE